MMITETNFLVNIHEKDVYEFTLKMQSQLIISSINLYNKDLITPTTSLYQKQIHQFILKILFDNSRSAICTINICIYALIFYSSFSFWKIFFALFSCSYIYERTHAFKSFSGYLLSELIVHVWFSSRLLNLIISNTWCQPLINHHKYTQNIPYLHHHLCFYIFEAHQK